MCFSAGPTTWSDIWTPARPLQSCESTSPRSLCFYPGEAQPSTPIFRAVSPLNFPWSISSRQEHPRNAFGSLWKCLGVTLYKCCLFVITCFLFLPKHTSSLLACICTLLRIYLINSLLGCLSLLRCGHSTGILVLLRLFINCKCGVFVGDVCRGVILNYVHHFFILGKNRGWDL